MNYLKLIFFLFVIFGHIKSLNATLLDEIKERGFLICGVSEPRIGFADIDDQGKWKGLDVDMCKAVSAAIFGNSDKIEFVQTTNRSRFPLLYSGELDMLSRITTWTFSRDVNLGFEFPDVYFFDGQGFMVKSSLGINSAIELDGANICVIKDSVFTSNINKYFEINNIFYNPIYVELNDESFENFMSDRCDVYSDYITELGNKRITLPNSSSYLILPEVISKEPLSLVVRQGDDAWRDLVSWSFKVMIIAEELGINSQNIDNFIDTENGEIMRLLGIVGSYGDMIELNEKWAYNIIKYVGNFEEVFNRNLGPDSVLNLNRGLNNLYINGGLFYAPPFR